MLMKFIFENQNLTGPRVTPVEKTKARIQDAANTDGRNYLRIIFLKNIDFSVKTICKDKSLQKRLHKDASEEDIFTASF